MRQSKNFLLAVKFLGIFAILAAPAVFLKPQRQVQKVSVRFAQTKRGIASVATQSQLSVPQRECQTEKKWQYRCDKDRKNCTKMKQVSYLNCKTL